MLSPRATRTVRWLHLWGGVIVGLQIILWVISGLVMVARPIDAVRGTDLRRDLPALAMPAGLPALQGVEKLELGSLLGKPVWKLTDARGKRLLDAATGQPISLTPAEAEAIARAGTTLTGPAVVTAIAADSPPLEWRRNEPAFRVTFADDTRVFVTMQGEIGAIRTPWWRFYDLFWGLHIMDWSARENTHSPLIIAATLLSLGVVLTGALLTVRHFWRR